MVCIMVILSVGCHERNEVVLDLDSQFRNQNIWF